MNSAISELEKVIVAALRTTHEAEVVSAYSQTDNAPAHYGLTVHYDGPAFEVLILPKP